VTSTLGFGLLGLLARGPASGYDIARQLREGIQPFWHARHSQIYPELARLEADQLVSHQRVEQRDRPDKKLFSITDAGRVALSEWVTSPFDVEPIRDELTLRAYSLWVADPLRAADVFRAQAQQHRDQLARYEQVERDMQRQWGPQLTRPDTPEFASYATLRRGLAHERELTEWCAWLADAVTRPH
jgi:DNA-binding PadR family transcriptional regulator